MTPGSLFEQPVSREALRAAAQKAIDDKTKPVGSLGQLEEVAVRLAVIQQTLRPRIDRSRILVFAADHGVAAENVSAYPSAVTAQMMANYAHGGAAVSVLARTAGIDVEVIDVGVDADLRGLEAIRHAKVRRSSRNIAHMPAMTLEECEAALGVGRSAVQRAVAAGIQVIGLGEMGIGNTTASAALLAALLQVSPEETVGRGAGLNDAQLAHKRTIVAQSLKRHAGQVSKPFHALSALGGLELAAIAGAAIEAAQHSLAVVVDGFIATVAILAAVRMQPAIHEHLFFAHQSSERGHRLALTALFAKPLLQLDMRLGEGSATALAIPILKAAAAILREMATFEDARVSRRRA